MVLTLVLMAMMEPGTQHGIKGHSLSREARRHIMQGRQKYVHRPEKHTDTSLDTSLDTLLGTSRGIYVTRHVINDGTGTRSRGYTGH